MNDKLGDTCKIFEMAEAGKKLMPLLPICARIDGRAFSKFTKGLNRPYDDRLSNLMVRTTKYLVEATEANVGYTQSDEISLVWMPQTLKQTSFFGGRIQKICSILGSMATGFFNRCLLQHLSQEYYAKFPMFDARVWNVPDVTNAVAVLIWREIDATKNSVDMACRCYYSHKEMMHKTTNEKQEMLFKAGINWNDYPSFFKRGTYIRRRKVLTGFTLEEMERLPPKHEARSNPHHKFERTVVEISDLPKIQTICNKELTLFYGADPLTLTSLEGSQEN